MRKKIPLLIGLLLCVSLLANTPGKAAGIANNKEKVVDFAIPFMFEIGLDPAAYNYINLQPFFRGIYATPFRLDNNLRPYPFLIESYKRKKNKNEVTFRIKKDAKFSDGSDITSRDMVAVIQYAIKRGGSPSSIYKVINGGEAFFRGKVKHCSGIKIIDPKEFEIHFLKDDVPFEYYFTSSLLSVLPAGRNKDKNKMAFSGPFYLESREQKKKRLIYVLKRNPHYIGKKTGIDKLIVTFYREHDEFDLKILNGDPDLFLYNRRRESPRSYYKKYKYFKTPSFGGFYFVLNPRSGVFRDKRLRTFFKCFIRSWDFSRTEKWSLLRPSYLVLPYSLSGYFVFDPIPFCDYKKYAPKKKVTIKCVNADSGIRPELFKTLARRLKKYNIHLQLNWDSLRNIETMQRERTLDLTSMYYLMDVPLSYFFYESIFSPGYELNLFGYEVPEASKLLEEYHLEKSGIKKLRILSRLEEIAREEAFIIPFGTPLALVGYKENIKNVSIDKFLTVNFEDINVE